MPGPPLPACSAASPSPSRAVETLGAPPGSSGGTPGQPDRPAAVMRMPTALAGRSRFLTGLRSTPGTAPRPSGVQGGPGAEARLGSVLASSSGPSGTRVRLPPPPPVRAAASSYGLLLATGGASARTLGCACGAWLREGCALAQRLLEEGSQPSRYVFVRSSAASGVPVASSLAASHVSFLPTRWATLPSRLCSISAPE
jgi:hypothetical protein